MLKAETCLEGWTAVSLLEKAGMDLVWFDSMGAKSASVVVSTSRGKVVVDPGVAEMQPSYPLPLEEKLALRRRAARKIEEAVLKAVAIFITHYHYDHHMLPGDPDLERGGQIWLGKTLVLKNPNMYINESQWERSRLFIEEILRLAGASIKTYTTEPGRTEFDDPVEKLGMALSRDFGGYQQRREELLRRGKRWFSRLAAELWGRGPWIREIVLKNKVVATWGDGRVFEFGDTTIQALEPWFHGIEYDRTGWVLPLLVKRGSYRIFYTSDVMGPQIEDYAEYIAKIKPDVLILDGPPTYLFPYMINRVNLKRAIDSAIVLVNSGIKLVIYDHHLLREKRWRERVKPVFIEARKTGAEVLTAAEYAGRRPLIDTL
uniref:UPF0282 protein ENM78_04985 n=1 Tax=Fervidicoccus fontis TaxID=683846 RepID=A0A7J3ZL48_9CREN